MVTVLNDKYKYEINSYSICLFTFPQLFLIIMVGQKYNMYLYICIDMLKDNKLLAGQIICEIIIIWSWECVY